MWNVFDKRLGGLRGGKSKSKAKKAAARRNGKKGGRKAGSGSRTLGEFLLRRKLNPQQHETAAEGYFHLRSDKDGKGLGARSEKVQFSKWFGVDPHAPNEDGIVYVPYFLKTKTYNRRKPKSGTGMDLILQKFLSVARYKLKNS